VDEFVSHENDYTIVDVRNKSEVDDHKIFNQSINIPLSELNVRFEEIPLDKPIVVHCAGGYRSAAASSFLQSKLNGRTPVFDLGEAIKQFN
jgi:rhodanese-related sulfurtransferase